MKKILCILLSAVIIMGLFLFPASAKELKVPSTKAEIVADYNRVINELKEGKEKSVNVKGINNTDIKIIEGPASMETILQNVLDSFLGESLNSSTFYKGESATGESITTAIPPFGKSANLSKNDVTSAKAEINADGGYDIILTLPKEQYIMEDGNIIATPTIRNKVFATSLDLSFAPVALNHIYVDFINSKITATVDPEGRLTHLCYEETDIIDLAVEIEKFEEAIRLKVENNMREDFDITYDYECTCRCHKKGIISFFWKIINFFERLFGKNVVCDCGILH